MRSYPSRSPPRRSLKTVIRVSSFCSDKAHMFCVPSGCAFQISCDGNIPGSDAGGAVPSELKYDLRTRVGIQKRTNWLAAKASRVKVPCGNSTNACTIPGGAVPPPVCTKNETAAFCPTGTVKIAVINSITNRFPVRHGERGFAIALAGVSFEGQQLLDRFPR